MPVLGKLRVGRGPGLGWSKLSITWSGCPTRNVLRTRVLQLGQGIRDPNRRNRQRDHSTASVQATPNLVSLADECGTGSDIPRGFYPASGEFREEVNAP
jgi:hypothetical protein